MKKILLVGLMTLFILNTGICQTNLGLGDIAFTSYNADNLPNGMGSDAFTFVLLVDVTPGTTITFTDDGWGSGFQQLEQTCTLTFGSAYTCGSQITISRAPFIAMDAQYSNAGSMSGQGLNLSSIGDQIFAYQGTQPVMGNESNFIAAIQMNNFLNSGTPEYWDGAPWDQNSSSKPSVFTSGVNAIYLGANPVDNAQCNLSFVGGGPAAIRAAVNNPANWNTSDSNPFPQPPQCTFSCVIPSGTPYLSAVNPITNHVTISNCSNMHAVDISGYRLWSEMSNVTISSSMVVSGDLNIPASGSVVLGFIMDATGADLGLYGASGDFTDPTAMVDFTQWGTAGNGRESVAVSKGIWVAGTAAPGGAPYTFNGTCGTQNGETFWNGTGISDAAPGCNAFSQSNVVGTDAWFNITDASGNTIASVNPNGNDLGTVTVDLDDLAASPQNGDSEYYMPRNFNFTSSNFNGMPFANGGVHIRLYYLNAELSDYNTANSSTETRSTLVVRHYQGADEDCDVTNNTGAGDVVSTNGSGDYNTNGFYLEFTVPHFSEMGGSAPPTLEIELQDFSGVSAGVNNLLYWSTFNESNSNVFVVERLVDKQRFEAIGYVTATGNSSTIRQYKFEDTQVSSRTSYYRLAEIDQNEEKTIISEIIAITKQLDPDFSITPNPTRDNVMLSFTSEFTGNYDVLVYDLMGREVLRNEIQLERGFNQFEAATNQLNTGMYLLQVKTGTAIIYTQKFIKE